MQVSEPTASAYGLRWRGWLSDRDARFRHRRCDQADGRRLAVPNNFEWDAIAIVYDASRHEMLLYVNGNLEEVDETRVPYRMNTVSFDATGPLQFGRAKTDGTWGEYWPGVIDDVWAFQGAATQIQIQQLASGAELPTDPPPCC